MAPAMTSTTVVIEKGLPGHELRELAAVALSPPGWIQLQQPGHMVASRFWPMRATACMLCSRARSAFSYRRRSIDRDCGDPRTRALRSNRATRASRSRRRAIRGRTAPANALMSSVMAYSVLRAVGQADHDQQCRLGKRPNSSSPSGSVRRFIATLRRTRGVILPLA